MNNKPDTVPISEEKLAEVRKIVENATGKFLERLPGFIEDRLESAVAQILGFEADTWRNQWKVDHCNGRMSYISELLAERAKELAHHSVKGLKLNLEQDEKLKHAMQEDLAQKTAAYIDENLEKIAAEQAMAAIKSTLAETQVESSKISMDIKELAKPHYGSSILEKAVIERLVRKNLPIGYENA